MAGIYVHIPFCKKRCAYCDFYSTTMLARRKAYVEAVLKEIDQRRDEAGESIRTIYIGGGTPSTLEAADIKRIIDAIGIETAEEITMELNPGDANEAYMRAIRAAGINRLSIGIQSFQDELLQLIGRRHNKQEAIEAVRMAKEAGIGNISIDLMYALPTETMAQWEDDIAQALGLGVQHISSYGLMYEEGTALTRKVERGELTMIDEDMENAMYDRLCTRLKEAGYMHYEVSNFALAGYESSHNSSYWNDTPYIGIGASAHTYVGNVRSWNSSDMEAYIAGMMQGGVNREEERLTETDRYNERMMLGLRTNKGVARDAIKADVSHYIEAGLLKETADKRIVATQEGIHILNRIIEDLMI